MDDCTLGVQNKTDIVNLKDHLTSFKEDIVSDMDNADFDPEE